MASPTGVAQHHTDFPPLVVLPPSVDDDGQQLFITEPPPQQRPQPTGDADTTTMNIPTIIPSKQQSRSFGSSHRSGRSRRSSRSRDSITRAQNRVVFSTYAQYDVVTVSLLSSPLVLICISLAFTYAKDANMARLERSGAFWLLSWLFILILAMYMMVLPKQLNIRSNGCLGIKTFLYTYNFSDVCHVYQAEDMRPYFTMQSHRFATSLGRLPMVLRRRNQWDVLVTPIRPTEFLQNFESVLTRLEIQRANAQTNGGSGGSSTRQQDDEPPLAVVTATFV